MESEIHYGLTLVLKQITETIFNISHINRILLSLAQTLLPLNRKFHQHKKLLVWIYPNKYCKNYIQYTVQYRQFCFNHSSCTMLQVLKRITAYERISSEELGNLNIAKSGSPFPRSFSGSLVHMPTPYIKNSRTD